MENTERRYERNIYSQYEHYNKNQSKKNKIENMETFRKEFSTFSILNGEMMQRKGGGWDNENWGGIPVDYDREQKIVYVDSSESHTLLLGSTGSKKSRLVIMPLVNILAAAGESMIVSDPKAEIYRRTAGELKERGYKIHVINFRDPTLSDAWNLLALPYQLYKEGQIDKACAMVNDIAITLMPIQSTKDPYWDYSSRDLFVGLVVLLFKICKKFSFPDNVVTIQNLLDLRADMFADVNGENIEKTCYWQIVNEETFIKNRLLGIVSLRAEKTLSCILSTFDQHLSCYSLSPQLTAMFSKSTFEFDRFGYEKTALFLILPDEKTTYHKLAACLLKASYENLLDVVYKKEADNHFPKRINYVLDEFSSLPQISDFPQMISAARSRNIRFHLVVQSKQQLVKSYKDEAETIQSNCGNWIFLYTKEMEVLRQVSELGGKKGNDNLIPVYHLQHLDKEKGECLIFSNRLYPYYAFLPDINEYDGGKRHIVVFPTLKMEKESFDLVRMFSEKMREDGIVHKDSTEQVDHWLDDILIEPGIVHKDSTEQVDLETELEKKFDELFGSVDDSESE